MILGIHLSGTVAGQGRRTAFGSASTTLLPRGHDINRRSEHYFWLLPTEPNFSAVPWHIFQTLAFITWGRCSAPSRAHHRWLLGDDSPIGLFSSRSISLSAAGRRWKNLDDKGLLHPVAFLGTSGEKWGRNSPAVYYFRWYGRFTFESTVFRHHGVSLYSVSQLALGGGGFLPYYRYAVLGVQCYFHRFSVCFQNCRSGWIWS